jgi:hypothetical protein
MAEDKYRYSAPLEANGTVDGYPSDYNENDVFGREEGHQVN